MANNTWHNSVTKHSNKQNSYKISLIEFIIKVGLFDHVQKSLISTQN